MKPTDQPFDKSATATHVREQTRQAPAWRTPRLKETDILRVTHSGGIAIADGATTLS